MICILKLFMILIFNCIVANLNINTILAKMKTQNAQILTKSCICALQKISKLLSTSSSEDQSIQNLTPSEISQIFRPFSQMNYTPQIESLRGYCLQSIRKNQLALYVYQQVLTRFPLHIPTLRRKAQVLDKMGNSQQCQEMYKLAALLEPDNLHLQILKNKNDEHDQNSEQSEQDEQDEQRLNDMKSWKIKINSIDGEVRQIKSAKSVLFKKQIQEQEHPKSSQTLSSLQPKKSILKTKSYQHILTENKTSSNTQQNFDVKKIRSIDGKISLSSQNNEREEKHILFAFQECKNANTGGYNGLRRKSSLVASKIGHNK